MSVYNRNYDNMVATIEKAVRPLFLTSHVLGLGIYISKPYLSIFYNVTMWSAYSYLYYYIIIAFKLENWFLATSTLINYGINFLVTVTSIIMNFCQRKKLQEFVKRLAAVDDTLEELGTPKIYRMLHVCTKKVFLGWFVCSQMLSINDMIWWYRRMKNYWCIIVSYTINHCLHVNMFVDLIFTTYLWYIGTRFDKLNEHMRYLLLKEERSVRHTWRKIAAPTRRYILCISNYKRVFWTTMHLHLELCQLARKLNAMFEIQMTMEMVAYLVYLTRLFRYTFIHITAHDKYISSLIDWIHVYLLVLFFVARLFSLNYICESVSAKSNEMNKMIHRLTHSLRYADIRDEIFQFTLQIIHRPLKLSALGLFNFGNDFLRKFIITIVTFVTIVIQMPGASKAFMGF